MVTAPPRGEYSTKIGQRLMKVWNQLKQGGLKSRRALGLVAAAGLTGLGAYAVAAQVGGQVDQPPPGISQGVQADLNMTKPTHDGPTPWGNFLIVPVTAPSDAQDNELSPAPVFGESAVKTGELSGPDAPVRAVALVRRFVDLGEEGRSFAASIGLTAVGAEAAMNPDGAFSSGVLYARSQPGNAMIQLSALTPVRPIRITEFPDTAIYDFRTSTAVSDSPTITKFPDKGTSDPNGDREIRWSQNGVAYLLKSYGPISDDQLLAIAVEISNNQENQP